MSALDRCPPYSGVRFERVDSKAVRLQEFRSESFDCSNFKNIQSLLLFRHQMLVISLKEISN